MTNKITKIDRSSMQAMRDPINEVLAKIGEELGLKLRLGNGSYSPNGDEGHFKLELTVDDPALKEAAARAYWNNHCRYIGIDWDKPDETGLRPEDFGTEFNYGTAVYRTVGLAKKGRGSQKFPILVECQSDPRNLVKNGEIRMLPETAVGIIRRATDLANATPAPAPAKAKAKKAA
jgi:hypothetical protein